MVADDRNNSVIQLLPRVVEEFHRASNYLKKAGEVDEREIKPMNARDRKGWLWPTGPAGFTRNGNRCSFDTLHGSVTIEYQSPEHLKSLDDLADPDSATEPTEIIKVDGLGLIWTFPLTRTAHGLHDAGAELAGAIPTIASAMTDQDRETLGAG